MDKEITFDELVQKFDGMFKYIESLDGKKFDEKSVLSLPSGSFLHQTTEHMTEQESAEFEQNNKSIFNIIMDINGNITKNLE